MLYNNGDICCYGNLFYLVPIFLKFHTLITICVGDIL